MGAATHCFEVHFSVNVHNESEFVHINNSFVLPLISFKDITQKQHCITCYRNNAKCVPLYYFYNM
jgi:hypothetical protein